MWPVCCCCVVRSTTDARPWTDHLPGATLRPSSLQPPLNRPWFACYCAPPARRVRRGQHDMRNGVGLVSMIQEYDVPHPCRSAEFPSLGAVLHNHDFDLTRRPEGRSLVIVQPTTNTCSQRVDVYDQRGARPIFPRTSDAIDRKYDKRYDGTTSRALRELKNVARGKLIIPCRPAQAALLLHIQIGAVLA